MIKIRRLIPMLAIALFLVKPVAAAELSCPDGGGVMPVQYGDIINCGIESAGDLDVFGIAATEEDFISVNVIYTGSDEDNCTSLNLTLRAFDKKNKQLAIRRALTCSGTRIEFTAGEGSIHTVTIADQNDRSTGNYQVEFQCISGPCIEKEFVLKQTCAATYDGVELKMPHVDFYGRTYWANFRLINSDPFYLELDSYGRK